MSGTRSSHHKLKLPGFISALRIKAKAGGAQDFREFEVFP